MRKLSAKKRLLDAGPKARTNVVVGNAPAAHDRVERALTMLSNGCSASLECASVARPSRIMSRKSASVLARLIVSERFTCKLRA